MSEPADDVFFGYPSIARSLVELAESGARFSTVYADPPWRYLNAASRGAASNHYPTMSLEEICKEPVEPLLNPNAHLHLWTTNGFLREAFEVIEAWGFEYKSCLVWVKPQLGMGNYWRVSHEFLLLGVRGALSFTNRSFLSWVLEERTLHSRKPFRIRQIIEQVSLGPFLSSTAAKKSRILIGPSTAIRWKGHFSRKQIPLLPRGNKTPSLFLNGAIRNVE